MKTERNLTPKEEEDASSVEVVTRWLALENWPIPAWFDEHKKPNQRLNYEAYFANQLRIRYTEFEGEFRIILGNFTDLGVLSDQRAAIEDQIRLLHLTRKNLESGNPDLLNASYALGTIERRMIPILPRNTTTQGRSIALRSRLELLKPNGKDEYIRLLETAFDGTKNTYQLLDAFDKTIEACNRKALEDQINTGLQIERLKAFRFLGLLFVAMFLIVSPLVTNLVLSANLPVQIITGKSILITAWVNALGIALVGAAGGFLSGLLQVRTSRITLTQYQENMLKLQLKPIVGAFVSLILYVLLSWQILPGIEIKNAGSYIFAAFLSGFSERYFLKLIELKSDGEKDETVKIESSEGNKKNEFG